jgi:uncharacterized protein YbaR (Trm112 family)
MALDTRLLEILACPQDKGPLYYLADDGLLYNPRLRCTYSVRDDIPVMLPSEAASVDATEHERLMGVIEAQGIAATFESAGG